MTNTETCMREMRYILSLFKKSQNFDEQWILFKAYLNTVHSLSDNDDVSKKSFHGNELINFVLVLRSILHHQPARWHFGKHDVFPTELNFNWSQGEVPGFSTSLSLVIPKKSLESPELQRRLGSVSKKQLNILINSLPKISNNVLVVLGVMQEVQTFVEDHCKQIGYYTQAFDNEPFGYKIFKNT